jgi:acyl-coenzyme A thioesterase PaaI-like protein
MSANSNIKKDKDENKINFSRAAHRGILYACASTNQR